MRVKKSWITLLVVVVAAGGAAAVALESRHAHHPFVGGLGPLAQEMAERHFERLADYLDLSPSQREELQALHEGHVEAMAGQFERLRAEFEQVHEMAGAESPDATAIGERVIALHRGHEALEVAREDFHRQVEALLTPEQAERFVAWRAARPWFEEDGLRFGGRDCH